MNVGVLASGEGGNLQAILDRVHAHDGVSVVAVGSDRQDARALARAGAAGVATEVFERASFPDRDARDAAMAGWLAEHGVDLVVLAGYMQLVSAAFLARFPQRVINVHPALLPAFPGLDAIGQAIAHGARVTGVTVHFVDEGVDSGPIIAQRAVEMPPGADARAVRDLLRPIEHELLCTAIRDFARGAIALDASHGRRVIVSPP